jgi:hypothetical protein
MKNQVSSRELAEMMLRWEDLQAEIAQLEDNIKAAVLRAGASQQVGRVKARFSKGRKSYQYEDLARKALAAREEDPEAVISAFTEVKTRVDWRAMVADLGYKQDEIPYTQSDPRVTIKLEA